MHFIDKPLGLGCECGEIHGFHFPHKMPMVIVVAVVVAQNASIVQWTTFQVDVSETIANNLAVFKPDLLLEQRTVSFPLEAMFLQPSGSNWWLSWAHGLIVSQIGL